MRCVYPALLTALLVVLPGASCNPRPAPGPAPTPLPSSQADAGRPLPPPTPPPVPPAPPAPPAPPPGPALGDVYDRACAAELAAGCSEGKDPKCAARMRDEAGAKIVVVPADCLAAAKTKVAVRACGSYASCK